VSVDLISSVVFDEAWCDRHHFSCARRLKFLLREFLSFSKGVGNYIGSILRKGGFIDEEKANKNG
jgi:hypothetical protein